MGPENQESLKEFAAMFQFLENCTSDDPVLNCMATLYGLMPMEVAIDADMSAHWKGLCKGGAAMI